VSDIVLVRNPRHSSAVPTVPAQAFNMFLVRRILFVQELTLGLIGLLPVNVVRAVVLVHAHPIETVLVLGRAQKAILAALVQALKCSAATIKLVQVIQLASRIPLIYVLFVQKCSVGGTWTSYSNYSACSSICTPGVEVSYRDCQNQTAGGALCTGSELRFRNCSGADENFQCDGLFNSSQLRI
jgi:hypothetical protein